MINKQLEINQKLIWYIVFFNISNIIDSISTIILLTNKPYLHETNFIYNYWQLQLVEFLISKVLIIVWLSFIYYYLFKSYNDEFWGKSLLLPMFIFGIARLNNFILLFIK